MLFESLCMMLNSDELDTVAYGMFYPAQALPRSLHVQTTVVVAVYIAVRLSCFDSVSPSDDIRCALLVERKEEPVNA